MSLIQDHKVSSVLCTKWSYFFFGWTEGWVSQDPLKNHEADGLHRKAPLFSNPTSTSFLQRQSG